MANRRKKRLTKTQRRTRIYQVVFIGISIIVLLTMVLSLVVN